MLAIALLVWGASVTVAFAATKSVPATRTAVMTYTVDGYDVDFTLPTNAKAGCMVCHGDSDLVRLKDGKLVSYWVDPVAAADSAHATVQCTGCHLDFAFKTPHTLKEADWQEQAKTACSNCHLDQSALVAKGSHGIGAAPGQKTDPKAAQKPLCGDCHGSHDIRTITDSPEGQAILRANAKQICGNCHQDYWDNYNDYYHGAAFKRGASDAPSCWDCHRGHDVLPTDNPDSSVNERHLVETCSQCHKGANESYVEYAKLIHSRQQIADEFFLYQWIQKLRSTVASLLGR